MLFSGYRQFGACLMASLFFAANMAVGVAVQAESEVSPADATWADRQDVQRVYNSAKSGMIGRTVPMVDIDTNTYEKKLWLSDKQLVPTPNIYGMEPKIGAQDSVVCVTYKYMWTLYASYSSDYGNSWTPPCSIQSSFDAYTHAPPIVTNNNVLIPYTMLYGQEDFLSQLLLRKVACCDFVLSDSTVIDYSVSHSGEAVLKQSLVFHNDTIHTAYRHPNYTEDGLDFRRSADMGDTWVPTGGSIPGAGSPHNLLVLDTAVVEVYAHDLQVWSSLSYDRTGSWTPEVCLSPNGEASQLPAASCDGISDVHVVWYDFEGAPPGWGGYVFYRRSLDQGETWSEVKSLSSDPYAEGVEISSTGDYVYAAWYNGSEQSPNLSVNFRYSRDRGATWSPEIVFEDTYRVLVPQICSQGDLIHFVWWEWGPPDSTFYALGVWYDPGDIDLTGEIDIADLVYMVDWMFTGGPAPLAYDAAQMDGLGEVDIADLVYIVDYMFNNGLPPVGGEGL